MTAQFRPEEGADTPLRRPSFLGLGGRGGRREFAIGAGSLVALEAAFIALLENAYPDGLGRLALIVLPIFLAPIVGIAIFATRRLHDLGLPAMLIFGAAVVIRLLLIPLQWLGLGTATDYIGLGLIGAGLVWLAIRPGESDTNEFGPPLRKRPS